LTPGRLNVFKFKNFKVMIDFAHNPAGYEAIEDYLKNIESNKKIGIISGVGDRRDKDIRECGKIAARMFDHIIIRNEKHLRGRTEDEINGLIIEGIQSIDKNVSYEIIPKEIDALKHAMSLAEEGTFITALSDVINNAIEIVQEYQAKELQDE
ncbi:MAG: cyanophycin synthetase, partial [Chryseobacterium sp.]|nr:cyanophycin synthetase [Chryseobacterium sp.]